MLLKLKRTSILISVLSVVLALSFVGTAAADATTVVFACANDSAKPVIAAVNSKHQVAVSCPSKAKIITGTTTKKKIAVRAACKSTETATYQSSTTTLLFYCETAAGKIGSNPTVQQTAVPTTSGNKEAPVSTGPTKDNAATSGNCSDLSKCDLIASYINPAINFLAAGVGVSVVISIVIGGIQYGSSAGDSQKVSAAKARIRNSIIALITFIFLYAMLNFLIPGGLGVI